MTGETRLAGVIGSPVRHSLSPTIVNAAFAASGLDWTYLAFEVAPGHGAEAVTAMRALGLGGLNVTMPHKAAAAGAVDRLTPVADALGAVNCVAWEGDLLVGHNTDGNGFLEALRQDQGVDPAGTRCAILGAGGAGRAVAWALGHAGAAEVVVINRSPAPAKLAAELAGEAGRVGVPTDAAAAELVVNATPLGMGADDPFPLDPELLRSEQTVVDLIYHPATTPWLRAADAAGATAINGLGMLIHQAALGFEQWVGQAAPIGPMREAALVELNRRSEFDATPGRGAT